MKKGLTIMVIWYPTISVNTKFLTGLFTTEYISFENNLFKVIRVHFYYYCFWTRKKANMCTLPDK